MPHFIWQNLSKGIFRKKRWFFTLRKLSLTWCACAHEHVHAHTHTHTHTYMLMLSCSVMSDSLWCHELQLTRLPCSWNFPVKNTEVGCHFLLQGISLIQGSNSVSYGSCIFRRILYHWVTWEAYVVRNRDTK